MITEILAVALLSVYLPHDNWINEDWAELSLRCQTIPFMVSTRPHSISRLTERLGEADCDDPTALVLRERIDNYLKDYEGFGCGLEAHSDSIARVFLRPRVTSEVGGLDLVIDVVLKVGESREYPNHTWADLVAVDYGRAYLSAELGRFSLLFGRENLRWGPSLVDPLLLSGNGPPLDMVMASYENGWLHFSSFFTMLDPEGDAFRYLSGHRIEVAPLRGLSIGLTETVLHGGHQTPPDLYYLNPLVFFYPREWNEARTKGNILVGIDFCLRRRAWSAYGELMIDDYPYEESDRNDRPKLGWTVGTVFLDVLRDGSATLLQYSGVHRWSYGHLVSWQEYSYRGFPIGHPLGNDFDRFLLRDIEHLGTGWDLEVNLSYTRHGEGRITDSYPEDRFPDEYFLSGVVERRIGVGVGIRRLLGRSSALELTAGWEKISNYQNVESASCSQPSLRLELDKNY